MHRLLSIHTVGLCSCVVVFYAVSQILFDYVFLTSKIVIDEEFHVSQGLAYCNFTFNTWNPKITTLPGLYLISAALLGPFKLCSIYWLRFVNLLGAVLNLLLIYCCFITFNKNKPWVNLLSAINLSLLPPLYFFSYLYYTDVISVTFILLFVLFDKMDRRIIASVFGMMSVIMRQTNIIWVVMIFGQYLLQEVLVRSHQKNSQKSISTDITVLISDIKTGVLFKRLPLNTWLNIAAYSTVLVSFMLFVAVNGSIVVGDKTAHTASLHIPQLFYYITFCLVFGWPYFIKSIFSFLWFIRREKSLTIILMLVFTLIIYYNTLEHPYLLADNRHYVFYIWNRFYRQYSWFRYAMVPVYYFAFYVLCAEMHEKYDEVYLLSYIICTSFVLVLQKMIEFRYFLIPYIFLRLHLKHAAKWQLICEFVSYCVLNAITFYIFFTKDVYWSDFSDVQKLIW